MDVWTRDAPACQVYIAEGYTRKFPDDFFGWLILADGLTQISSFHNACIALRTAIRLSPIDHRDLAYTRVGKYYLEKGNLLRAQKWYRKAVDLAESQENLVFLGACMAKQGKYDEARYYHNRAVESDPTRADEALFNLGLICRAESKYVEALRYFNKSIELDPEYEEAQIAREDIMQVLELQASDKSVGARRRKVRDA